MNILQERQEVTPLMGYSLSDGWNVNECWQSWGYATFNRPITTTYQNSLPTGRLQVRLYNTFMASMTRTSGLVSTSQINPDWMLQLQNRNVHV